MAERVPESFGRVKIGDAANCRFLTPRFLVRDRRFRLPVFDASKTEDRIPKTGNRRKTKRRRQKRVVGRKAFAPKNKASETGSWW
jgi:hypothetical protein